MEPCRVQILPDTLYIERAFGGSDTEKKHEVDRATVKPTGFAP
jgi:hypothetical protein